MAFELPPLPYEPDALEPVIDAETMTIHHDKHHGGYVKKLNNALEGTALGDRSIEELLQGLDGLPEELRRPVRHFGGGHYNHSLFWPTLTTPIEGGGEPSGDLADMFNDAFGSFDRFRHVFSSEAAGLFGSGWAWLCLEPQGRLTVASTQNQDPPFLPEHAGGLGVGQKPILGLDVWEHAFYLSYRNDKASYIDKWWHIVNWDQAAKNLERARSETSVLAG